MKSIIISDEQIRLWFKELEDLEREIGEKHQRAELLRERIAAIPLFDDDAGQALISDEPEAAPDEGLPEQLPAAVRFILKESGRSMTRIKIREELIRRGFDKAKMGANYAYFYTVLRRLVKQGEVRKRGKSFRIKEVEATPSTEEVAS